MCTIAQTIRFFNGTILPHVLPKWHQRFRFAFAAFSLQPIESLNANGRSIVRNRRTAETKVARIVRTAYFLRLFPSLLPLLGIVQTGDRIAVDFSDFRGRQVLMFAKQTDRGRAIPLYFAFLRYPITSGSQNTWIIQTTERFLSAIGVPVHLVCDRGFALPAYIQFLAQRSDVTFTIRIKAGKHVVTSRGRSAAVSTVRERDAVVTAYGRDLRIVRSPKARGTTEPWYLVTNDRTTAPETLVAWYAHRFEIEEFFKDAKRLADLEYLSHVSDQTFTIVLWFLLLGFWVAWCATAIRTAWEAMRARIRPHRWLSLLRWFWEEIERERGGVIRRALWGPKVAARM